MSFRALTNGGDFTWGKGVQNYLQAEAAIVADIKTALKTFLGEAFWAVDFGVDWWNLLGGKSQEAIVLQCRQIIASRDGVTKINSVAAALDSRTRQLSVTFNIDTIYSRNAIQTVAIP